MTSATISPEEVARFNAMADRWWDPDGPMRPLHRMNPTRVGWIDDRIRRRFPQPVDLRLLDVGCGAGLAAEALARLGYDVLGLDAAPDAIAAAAAHAADSGLKLHYRVGAAEDLVATGERFPVITALEVIEHVSDPARFVQLLAGLLEPGGVMFLSTLNRTARSFVTAKVGAEYLLRWLPIGTHDWRKFITPAEMGGYLRGAGLLVTDTAGLIPEPGTGRWHTGRDMSVNYLIEAAG